jgi:hypothetical protein
MPARSIVRQSIFAVLLLCSALVHGQDEDFEERKYTKEKGFEDVVTIEFNMAFGLLDVEGVTMAGLQTTYGVEIGNSFTVGAGTGLHLYDSERFLPVFAEVRWLPGKSKTHFMLGGSIGAYYGGEDQVWDRYLNPFMGFSHQAFESVEFTLSVGLIYKEYEVPTQPERLPDGSISNIAGIEEVVGRFFSVRFGCRF